MRLAGFVVVIAAILRFAAFAILHRFIFTNLVGDGSAARAYSTADESAFAASGKRAYGGTTSSGTTDDFDASVVLMIFLGLFSLGAIVLRLCNLMEKGVVLRREWEGK